MGPEWVTAIDAWARELRALGRSPATVVTRRRWVTLLAGSPGMPEPAAVTREHLIDWMAGQTWAPNTRRSARASARGFFAWARERGIRGDDPTADIPGVRVPPPLPHPAPEARFRAAVAAATPRAELALMLAGFAGLRRAEIAQARREDLDDFGLWVRGKGGRARLVPVTPSLRQRVESSPPGWLFPARWGDGHMHVDAVGKMVRRVLGLGPHSLRHRFATRAYAATHDLRAVQTLLGHSSPASTAAYVAVADEALCAAVAAAA